MAKSNEFNFLMPSLHLIAQLNMSGVLVVTKYLPKTWQDGLKHKQEISSILCDFKLSKYLAGFELEEEWFEMHTTWQHISGQSTEVGQRRKEALVACKKKVKWSAAKAQQSFEGGTF